MTTMMMGRIHWWRNGTVFFIEALDGETDALSCAFFKINLTFIYIMGNVYILSELYH